MKRKKQKKKKTPKNLNQNRIKTKTERLQNCVVERRRKVLRKWCEVQSTIQYMHTYILYGFVLEFRNYFKGRLVG